MKQNEWVIMQQNQWATQHRNSLVERFWKNLKKSDINSKDFFVIEDPYGLYINNFYF